MLQVQDVFDEKVKQGFIYGLEQFDKECESITGKILVKLNYEERHDYLEKVDGEVMPENRTSGIFRRQTQCKVRRFTFWYV